MGKIERWWSSLWRECLETAIFVDLQEARTRIGLFIDYYNFQRVHQSLDGLVPADRFFGRWEEVKEAVDAESRRRQGASILRDQMPLTEELLPQDRVELLRLMVCAGELELRFLGHRVRLGRVEP